MRRSPRQRGSGDGRRARPASPLDALVPVAALIVLIALTIALLGIGATDGPLQVALARGMFSMLTTVWLILGALSYPAVMEHAGFLATLGEG